MVFGTTQTGKMAYAQACAIIHAAPLHAGMPPAMTQAQTKLLIWMLLSALAALLTYATFRGYLSPDFLLGFANTFSC